LLIEVLPVHCTSKMNLFTIVHALMLLMLTKLTCGYMVKQQSQHLLVPSTNVLLQSQHQHQHHQQQYQQLGNCRIIESKIKSRRSTELHAISIATPLKICTAIATGITVVGTAIVKLYLDKPSRSYGNDTVAREYDAWADDGILEYYWGEHIHLGYYSTQDVQNGYIYKNFIQAKYDFIDEMMKFGNIIPSNYMNGDVKILDVGCGFGGTSRYLAKALGPKSHVTGITLSPKQVERGTELAYEQGVANNTNFMVMNALAMEFPDNTFDIVWACESGEHMPDKEAYINEMMRVLKPGGKFVMACWSQRDDPIVPYTKRDLRDLNYLYEEWTHPFFISVPAWAKLMEQTGVVEVPIKTANWVNETIASWRHSIAVGVIDPRGWIFKPKTYIKCVRDAYCIERMHRAFKRGLMEYGMFATTKTLK
jgi:MPBQ/MSBQ methyltransferase